MRKEIRYSVCGTIYKVAFLNKNELLHNENGPASYYWHKNGLKGFEKYHSNGPRHNTAGSAVMIWSGDGQELHKAYCVYDKEMTKEEWEGKRK